MCPINRTIHRGAIINFLLKEMLNRKMNKFLLSKHKGTNVSPKMVKTND